MARHLASPGRFLAELDCLQYSHKPGSKPETKRDAIMDYSIGQFIQEAINNYDLSDIINQVVIGILMITLLTQANIRIKFSNRTYY
jgi:hypothetical protein